MDEDTDQASGEDAKTPAKKPRAAATSASYSITMRLHTVVDPSVIGRVATSIAGAGGIVTAWDGGSPTAGGRIIAAGDKRVHEAAMKILRG